MSTKSLGNFVQCPVCRTSHAPTNGALKDGVYASTCENCGHFFKFKATGPLKSSVTFTINGTSYTVGNQYAAALSLNEFMRSQGVSYGTKVMCMEGGCGVCLVTTTLYDPITKAVQTYTVNSCLVPLYTCDGMQVTTIEGLGNPRDGLHPIQDRLAQYNGSQCGFCSPAQVMNMYGLLKRTPKPTMQQVENAYDTSICRCTGYRPILDAMKSFAADAAPNLPGGAIDIEELDKKICSKTGKTCTGHCSSEGQTDPEHVPLHIVLQGSQWYKPTTRQQLYALLGQHKGDNYRLVFGNSGYGVYKELSPWLYDVLIDLRGIQEFYDISVDSSRVMFGPSITLTNMMEVFETNGTNPGLSYFRDFASHVAVIANTGVRNLGSWAGNLMLKNLHTEFPSDVFTIFETVGATLTIGSSDGTETSYSLIDFLNLDMKGKVILSVTLPTFPSGDVYVKTFKITPRHQNAHAYVTAGFRMQLDRNNNFTVKTKPSLVYGGISKTLVHAGNTETYLQGKQLGDPAVLKSAIATLSAELVPDTTPGLSSTTYRKNLAVSLFYKCVLGMCGEKAAARFRSGGNNLIRPVSSGTQTYDSRKDEYPLTEPMTKVDATLQTSGRVQYVNDVPPVQGEVFASFVISSVGNAEIDSVDTSAALSSPGALKYISASDIPKGGSNSFRQPGAGVEEIFCSGRVLYSGQPIGIIVAVDKLSADRAASMVKVTYKNVQPPIITMEDAIQKKSIFPNVAQEFKVGDAAAAIATSDKHVSGRIKMGHQYHFHMETQVSICYPAEDGVGVSLLSSTQWTDLEQLIVAKALNIPESSVNVTVRRLGGSYGAKITRAHLSACAAAIGTHVMRRPVRLNMNFHTNMKTIGKRFPYLADYTVGVTNEGKLNGIQFTVNADCGMSPNDCSLASFPPWMDNAYYCPAWDFKPVALKTNLPTNTACRGPGSCPAIFIMETMMDHVAKVLNQDQLEFRKLNLFNKGQKSANGMVLEYCNIKDMVAQLETSADVQSRKQQVTAFNQANRWKKKGISVMPLRWDLNYAHANYNVYMTVYHGDGSVAISIGGVENGQGINTKMMQVCAFELGIPMDTIKVKPTTTLADSNSITTGGSITSEVNALGVMQCCQQLKTRMAPVKAKMVNPTWQQLVAKCYSEGMDLSARNFTNPTGVSTNYNIYGATCTEVEVDVLTGENQINRVDILYDCGESMNPEIDIGQAEGAFVMGLGYWMTEQMIFDPKTGTALTDGTWEYKPPLGKDIPIDFRIQFLKNAPNPRGVLRAKAVGEPPLCMAASALFAVKHAIEAARKEISKDTFFPLDGPATVEVIQGACQVDNSQLVYGT
ncbi:indole-3-acetaldehyde oxidase-like isoform X2 [Haliotis rufescens]|uniref:indole-3-acetaldehyde oxidase-like isoform X1 n=1 Tax=Haliotis rufescens TaxID=6454 RepID=UPI00201FA387|nr:indole-3-acetaldehyde oxidase-like isoform X1 [Haliotis rufescens]XP_048242206.1 indole-3-acetaldehyde oxidase-like isoform X2 [Haliotis rufescens]